jgi:putative SOS response-associated peptidase YedK
MCGRWSLVADEETLISRFGAELGHIRVKPRYNIAPMQEAIIIRNDEPKKFSAAKWGLLPNWAKDEKIAFSTINARAEGIEDKPAYREAFKKHRCLIPADGFYE